MKSSFRKISEIILLNIVYFCIIFVIVMSITPMHKFFHYIPCVLSGSNAIFSSASVECSGINEKSDFIQFLYFIGPYIAYLAIIAALYYLSKKVSWLKYFIPLFTLDAAYNYFASMKGSDFLYFYANTGNNLLFYLSMTIVIGTLIITIYAYSKLKIYEFKEIMEKKNISEK